MNFPQMSLAEIFAVANKTGAKNQEGEISSIAI